MASLELQEVSKILGGKKVLRREFHDYFDFIELGSKGVPKSALMNLANYLDLSLRQIAQLLPISERTISRYHAKKLFNRVVSEQILSIAEITAKGVEVFEEKEKFLTWLNQPNTALANESPINLLKSRFGTGVVLDEIRRIEYGVFS